MGESVLLRTGFELCRREYSSDRRISQFVSSCEGSVFAPVKDLAATSSHFSSGEILIFLMTFGGWRRLLSNLSNVSTQGSCQQEASLWFPREVLSSGYPKCC